MGWRRVGGGVQIRVRLLVKVGGLDWVRVRVRVMLRVRVWGLGYVGLQSR